MAPLVSVIIPTYNRSEMLKRALESVRAQTFPDYEIVVIDDGSEDDTPRLVASLPGPIRYVRIEQAGPAAARNAGIEAAAGELLAFLDSDDEWLPEHLARTVPILQERQEVGLVYHAYHRVDESGRRIPLRRNRPQPGGRVTGALFAYDFILPSTVVCRRSLVCRAGAFDSRMVPSEDYDLWLRMSLLCEFAFVGEPLALRRIHAGNISRQRKARNEIVRAILKERFCSELGGREVIRPQLSRAVLAKAFYRSGRLLWLAGHRASARQLLRHALRYRPAYPRAILVLAAATVGPTGRPTESDPLPEVLATTGWRLGGEA